MSKVNIIIPVYNVAPYLSQFMDSLQNQTCQDFDIVAVDDKSTDDSLFILKSYKGFFGSRLKIIRNRESLGPGRTRNVGLENLPQEGDYILFLDSDDCLEAVCLEKTLAEAEMSQADIVVYGSDRFEENIERHSRGEMLSNPETVVDYKCKELAYMNTFLWNKLFRRKVIGSLRFINMKRWEDTLFLFQVLPHAAKIKFINKVLYHYRQRNDSLTGGLTENGYYTALEKFQAGMLSFRENHKEEYEKVRYAFETQVFMRCAVGGVCRMALKNMKNSRHYIREMKIYLDETIPDWRKNPYLMLHGLTHRSMKENAVMMAALLYRCNLFIVFVYGYWLMKTILKTDVRY